MRLSGIIKTLLLGYLAIAVLFPLYGYSDNGSEVHFLGIFEAHTGFHRHNQHEMEASHDRGHSHSLIHFYPVQMGQILSYTFGNFQIPFAPSYGFSIKTNKG